MSSKLSRREVLKLMAAGSVGVAGSSIVSLPGFTRHARADQSVKEITFWQPPIWRYAADNETVVGAGSDDWINDAIARFEAANPDVKVQLELVPWDQWGQKVATGFASGDLPNVIYSQLSVDRVQAGIFEPLDDYVAASGIDSNWLPGLKEAVTVFNRIYAIPAIVNPFGMALSKSALERHGGAGILTAVGEDRSGLTFDMMREYGAAFGDGSSRYFFGVPSDHGSIVYWMFGSWLRGWGVESWSSDEERWIVHDNPKAVEAFQWLVDAQNDKIMIPNLPKWSDVDNFYWNMDTAARWQWQGIQAELEVAQEAGQAPDEFDIVLVGPPHAEDVAPFAAGSGPAASYSVTRTPDPDVREAAFRFAAWLANDDSNAVSLLVNGYFPATISGSQVIENHPAMEDSNRRWIVQEYLPNFAPEKPGGNWQPVINARTARIWNQINPWDYYIQQYQSLMLGQKTPEEMLLEMATRINGALGAAI